MINQQAFLDQLLAAQRETSSLTKKLGAATGLTVRHRDTGSPWAQRVARAALHTHAQCGHLAQPQPVILLGFGEPMLRCINCALVAMKAIAHSPEEFTCDVCRHIVTEVADYLVETPGILLMGGVCRECRLLVDPGWDEAE